jgi:hypothetical protein
VHYLKTLGLLALVASACELFLLLTVGPINRIYSGWGARLGEELGAATAIFIAATLGATIAAIITRKRYSQYPGFATGAVVAVILTLMAWMARTVTV